MDYDYDDDYYDNMEPSEEDLIELERILQEESEAKEYKDNNINSLLKHKNRVFHEYSGEDVWRGWLKLHGMRW
jgi:hypothetical protein